MKISRLYTGKDNLTYFDDIDIELNKIINIGKLSKTFPATGYFYIYTETTKEATAELQKWHNPAVPTLAVNLAGKVRIQAASGESRIFSTGSVYDSVVLMDSVNGKGHISEVLEGPHFMLGVMLSGTDFSVNWV